MTVHRQQVGATENYRGHKLRCTLLGPDFLGYVDDIELSGFFISPNAAIAAGQKYVNDKIASEEKVSQQRSTAKSKRR